MGLCGHCHEFLTLNHSFTVSVMSQFGQRSVVLDRWIFLGRGSCAGLARRSGAEVIKRHAIPFIHPLIRPLNPLINLRLPYAPSLPARAQAASQMQDARCKMQDVTSKAPIQSPRNLPKAQPHLIYRSINKSINQPFALPYPNPPLSPLSLPPTLHRRPQPIHPHRKEAQPPRKARLQLRPDHPQPGFLEDAAKFGVRARDAAVDFVVDV